MKEIFKYEFMLIVNGNARVRIFFSDGGSRILTIAPELLASYDSILKQPHVAFDTDNEVFVSRDRFENKDLKTF
jgi:hypothetical protein